VLDYGSLLKVANLSSSEPRVCVEPDGIQNGSSRIVIPCELGDSVEIQKSLTICQTLKYAICEIREE
jgi:hypothetical protein